MKFKHRLGFFLGGFSIGLVFLAFFLKQKKTKFTYGPNDRVLKNINDKPIQFSENVRITIEIFQIDTLAIYDVLENGNVNFNVNFKICLFQNAFKLSQREKCMQWVHIEQFSLA